MKIKTRERLVRGKVVFLFDVDNTLLDNDRVIADLLNGKRRNFVPPSVARVRNHA